MSGVNMLIWSFSEITDMQNTLHIFNAPMIIKNFVEGDDRCNYERYLVEMLNYSMSERWFCVCDHIRDYLNTLEVG